MDRRSSLDLTEADAQATVRVRLRLSGGHSYELWLPADSRLYRELVEQPRAEPPQAGESSRLYELPLDGGRTSVKVRGADIVAVETTPSFRPASVSSRHEERPAAILDGPPVFFRLRDPIRKHLHFPEARKRAKRYLKAFDQRRSARQAELRRICERMGRRTFVVSAFNAGFVPLMRNWAASCDRHGVDVRSQALLFPTDETADAAARELGFTTYFDIASYGPQPVEAVESYAAKGFDACVFLKLAMAQDMLDLGYDFLLQDMDLVWLADPVPELTERAMVDGLDFQFMRDLNRRFQPLYYNSGFFFACNNVVTRRTWKTIFSAYDAVVFYRSDQTVLNQVVSCFKERGLRTARLPERYADGQILARVARGRATLPEGAVVAHVNWTVNLAQKIERLKRVGLWYLD